MPSLAQLGKGISVLPRLDFMVYTTFMDDLTFALILILVTVTLYYIGLRWWRYRRAAKLADNLLAEVVKGKDSFRR